MTAPPVAERGGAGRPAAPGAAPAADRAGAEATTTGGRRAGPPLRVAFCIDNLAASGGTELNAVRTAERLDPARVRLSLVSLQPDGPMRARYEAAGVPVRHFSPGGSLAAPAALRGAARLGAHLRAERVDVVHAHDLYTNVFCGLAARAAGVPGVVTSKRWWRPRQRGLHALNALAYHASSRVLANSAAVRDSLWAMERVPARKCWVVPNFLDDADFAPVRPGEAAALRARFGVPAGAPLVGIVARLRPGKNHAALVRAAALLADRWPDLHVAVVGEGETRADLGALAAALGLGERVHFAGHVDARERPSAAFDVAVLCSDQEGFPNAVIEAMAAARPVVATRVGGVPDAVEDGVTGRLVAPGAAEALPRALADALAPLIADPAAAARLGAAGHERAAARFRAGPVLEDLMTRYERLVPAAARRGR